MQCRPLPSHRISPSGNEGGDEVNLSGSGTLKLSPPTDGHYRGIVLFQNRASNGKITLSGGASSEVSGVIYAPSGELDLSGGSDAVTLGSLNITGSLRISGHANIK